MLKPTWKVVANHPDYMISSEGEVRTRGYTIKYEDGESHKVKSELIAPQVANYSYVRMNGSTCFIHRLVAEHFIPNPDHYRFVEHIDGNKANNSVINLRWCKSNPSVVRMQENYQKDGYKTGKSVICVETNQKFRSIKEAAEAFGLKYSVVRNAIGTGRKVNELTFI